MTSLRQEFRQHQRLEQYLQPQQILRSELIQLPLLELELRVRQELVENPFLDEMAEDEVIVDKAQAEIETEQATATFDDHHDDHHDEHHSATNSSSDEAPETPRESEVDWENFLQDEDRGLFKSGKYMPEDAVETPQPFIPSLSEYLEDQLRLQRLDGVEVRIGQYYRVYRQRWLLEISHRRNCARMQCAGGGGRTSAFRCARSRPARNRGANSARVFVESAATI